MGGTESRRWGVGSGKERKGKEEVMDMGGYGKSNFAPGQREAITQEGWREEGGVKEEKKGVDGKEGGIEGSEGRKRY